MDTYFAPSERASDIELKNEIEIISNNPIIDGLMMAVGGFLAILNEQRQILAINDSFKKMLGISDLGKVLGIRPGEAIGCVYARENPGGCGTSRHCATCGAAVAMMDCLDSNEAEEKFCAATVEGGEKTREINFKIRCVPISINDKRFILMFLQDMTEQHQWAAFESTFFHDIGNMVNGLVGASKVLAFEEKDYTPELVKQINLLSSRLAKEMSMQRILSQTIINGTYQPEMKEVTLEQIFLELNVIFINHPAAKGKQLNFPGEILDIKFNTDISLLIRVLINMVINALEAVDEGNEVKLWVEQGEDKLSFLVWNPTAIPEDVSLRIFQRHFSTKEKMGRGIGTYSMKLFGEQYLKGKVSFTTSEAEGTVFRLALPVEKEVKASPAAADRPLRILLVEDELFNRDLALILLERTGHMVIPAANGLEALEILTKKNFDMILMDDQMPQMDGVTATQYIRQCEQGIVPELKKHQTLFEELAEKISGFHIPIIATTAHAMSGDRERYIKAGMDDYLPKPFEPNDVLATFNRIIV